MTVHGGHLGPGADPHAVGLRDAAVADQRVRRRLAVGPHALLEGAPQLGAMGLADEVSALVVKGRIQEEPVVLESEVLVGLADTAFAERHELLALGESAHGDGPFLKCDRHRKLEKTRFIRGAPSPTSATKRTLP